MAPSLRIGVVAPGTRIDPALAERVKAFATDSFLDHAPEIIFHPQCFESAGHFAGDDGARAGALIEFANDPSFNAIWFARGGYGACRIAEAALSQLNGASRLKTYLGYSDNGAILGGLYARGYENVAHGPIPVDMTRAGGEGAVKRALNWLIDRAPESVELGVMFDAKCAAFNLTVFQSILGTSLEPDLSGHVLMLEDVGEYLYRLDRALFQITASANVRSVKGIKLGRISEVPENDKPFGATAEEMTRYWCAKAGIAYLGRCDIGHDIENKVVPFGSPKR
ncbi:LD-carboxypeptidase [Candidatus Viadribacter manganicus]|uniref:LD-carboxypeptidase n=1 Tax=Candidatus Viadribacter manganicus TaxID=1759059 RepID=A0A1B1AD57_9PROT|nr:LD-carboxypeptidase [Candidatus Viadribacter manganicus]ANP44495.1 LD-carboxypeptidase [Candidatus Viadribacter manganicus]